MKKAEKNVKISFAGANTGSGFRSFYDTIFPESKLDGLYIIKGGPGTGKSTFMKKLSGMALKMGHTVEHFLCGSDASSLDGVIVNGRKGGRIGVIDGTPPHPREFRSPGAAGDILNFGVFWDSGRLRCSRNEIDMLVREKQACFDTAYRYLGAANKIDSHIQDVWNKAYNREKGRAAAVRLLDHIGTTGESSSRQLSSYTMNGVVSLPPDTSALREYVISGNKDSAYLFLADVVSIVRERGLSAEISFSPINMRSVESIFFRDSGVWIHPSDDSDEQPEKIINMQRFIDKKVIAEYRQRIRFGKKCKDSLIDGAVAALSGARMYHFELEEIYKERMNFEALEKQSSLWYSEILSRLD